MFFNEIIHHFHYLLSHLPRTPLYSVTKGCIYTNTCAQRPCYTYANAVALTSTHAYTIHLYPFLFDSMREGSPSVWADFQGTLHLRADLQGALHLRTLITIDVSYPLLLCDWVTKCCYSFQAVHLKLLEPEASSQFISFLSEALTLLNPLPKTIPPNKLRCLYKKMKTWKLFIEDDIDGCTPLPVENSALNVLIKHDLPFF